MNNESPTDSTSTTPEPAAPRLSSYPQRAVAFILDSLLGSVIALAAIMLVIYPIMVPDYQERMTAIQDLAKEFADNQDTSQEANEELRQRLTELISPLGTTASYSYLIVMTLFFTIAEIATKGSSPGKLLFRYRVYGIQNREPVKPMISLMRSFIKTFTLVINLPGFIGTLFFVGIVLLPAFSRRKQGLHDMLSKTVVMDEKALWVRVDQQSPSGNKDVVDI